MLESLGMVHHHHLHPAVQVVQLKFCQTDLAFQQFQSPSHPPISTRPKQLFVVLHLIGIVGPLTAVRKVHDHASHVIAAVPAMTNPNGDQMVTFLDSKCMPM